MFFGLFGKKKESEMPVEAPMSDAGMNNDTPMSSMDTPEEKPMGDAPAPAGAMPDTGAEGEGM